MRLLLRGRNRKSSPSSPTRPLTFSLRFSTPTGCPGSPNSLLVSDPQRAMALKRSQSLGLQKWVLGRFYHGVVLRVADFASLRSVELSRS